MNPFAPEYLRAVAMEIAEAIDRDMNEYGYMLFSPDWSAPVIERHLDRLIFGDTSPEKREMFLKAAEALADQALK